ncbi:hypothetical protein D1AOALGA4SA_6294 [Olavius algarvensis Delta 1 endosymbiont]|nr:hypothetical protein D1AOALGA4SA_6294 [Olavius algarvensis Delta 1 endosymbiont]
MRIFTFMRPLYNNNVFHCKAPLSAVFTVWNILDFRFRILD